MPMREELFVPEGHPLDLARSPKHLWQRVLDDPDFNAITAFSLIAVFAALYMTIHCPLPEEIFVALMTTT